MGDWVKIGPIPQSLSLSSLLPSLIASSPISLPLSPISLPLSSLPLPPIRRGDLTRSRSETDPIVNVLRVEKHDDDDDDDEDDFAKAARDVVVRVKSSVSSWTFAASRVGMRVSKIKSALCIPHNERCFNFDVHNCGEWVKVWKDCLRRSSSKGSNQPWKPDNLRVVRLDKRWD